MFARRGRVMAPLYGLTPAQADAVRAIGELIDALGRAPTLAELGRELDTTRSGAQRLVRMLRDRGWLMPASILLTARLPALPEPEIEITEAGRRALADSLRARYGLPGGGDGVGGAAVAAAGEKPAHA